MGMHLYCEGAYEAPLQIPTYLSYMIYSNNDGGPLGVFYRLEQYLRMEHQNNFNNANKLPKEQREEEREFWNGWLEYHLNKINKARTIVRKNPDMVKFGVM